MNDEKNNRKVIVGVLIIIVAIVFLGISFAYYIMELSGTANVGVAKWNVLVNGSASKTFTPKFTLDSNANVVDNKLAPASSMTGNIEINLEGTEVAVEVLASVDTSKIKNIIGESKISVDVQIDGVEDNIIRLPEDGAFNNSNGKKNVEIKITWDDDNGSHNEQDTIIGQTIENLEIPVTLTIKQYIEKQ